MRIDLHVHASERSGCSVSGEEDMIRAAIHVGLDALAFTDHERLVPASRLDELNRTFAPFRIFSGCELHTLEEEDVLVFGVQDTAIEKPDWHYDDLQRFVRERNGFSILAHPFRYRDMIGVDLQHFRPDAIEARSCNIEPHNESRIRQTAAESQSGVTYASDAHHERDVGLFHINLQGNPDSDIVLVSLLRTRAYSCEALDSTL